MKKKLALLSITLLFAAMSQAAIFSDGFENGMGNWTQTSGTHPQVCVAGGHSGSYMSDQSSSDTYADMSLMNHDESADMTNVVVTFWVKWDSSLDYWYDGNGDTIADPVAKSNYVMAYASSAYNSFAYFSNKENFAVSGDHRTNYLAYRTRDTSLRDIQVTTNILLYRDTWYEAKFVFSATAGLRGYWDGQLIFTDPCQCYVKSVRFGTPYGLVYAYASKGYMHVDDVSIEAISTISEPTTCQEVWQMGLGLAGDINEDCRVDFADLAIFCEAWLK